MRVKRLFLFSIFTFSLLPFAKAGGLVEKVQETYRRTDQFRADFVQKTRIEILDREVEEKGELVFAKPGRFLIHYKGARERKYISDGKTLWIYRPKEKEVEVYENLKDILSREALTFLGGLGEMTKEFKASEKREGEIVLIPKRKGSLFTQLILKIDPQTHLVSEATLFPKSGNESRYRFLSIKTNEPIEEKTFTFHESDTQEIRPMEL